MSRQVGWRALGVAASLGAGATLAGAVAAVSVDQRLLGLASAAILLALLSPRLDATPRGKAVRIGVLGALCVPALVIGARYPGLIWLALLAGLVAAFVALLRLVGRRRWLALGLTLLLGGGLATQAVPRPPPVHTWNLFHYVIGTKYFAELGYHDLYAGVLLVEDDGQFAAVTRVRDQRSARSLPVDEVLAAAAADGVEQRFSEARKEALRRDLAGLRPWLPARTWPSIVTDLGFNPSPAFLLGHELFLQQVDLGRPGVVGLLTWLQLPLVLAAVVAALWAFGLPATLWLTLWFGLYFGNQGRLFGGYFSYDWAALGVIAVALLVRGRVLLAAPLLAYAGLMRGFVGMLALGPALRAWRRGSPERRFVVALGMASALVLVLSFSNSRGAVAWQDWGAKIGMHAERISAGGRRVGLTTLFGEGLGRVGEPSDMADRRALVAERSWPLRLSQLGLLAFCVWALRRHRPYDAAVLGLFAAFVLVVISRYYAALFGLWLLVGRSHHRPEGDRLPKVLLFGVVALFAALRLTEDSTMQGRYTAVNLWLLGTGLVLLLRSRAGTGHEGLDEAAPRGAVAGETP